MENNEKIIIGVLRACDNRDSIKKVFNDYGINDISKKISLLNESMYNPKTFYSSGDINNNDEDKLNLVIDIFLMKDWKLNEYYEKAGL